MDALMAAQCKDILDKLRMALIHRSEPRGPIFPAVNSSVSR